MWQKLIFLFLLWSSVSAQSFFYSYIDPCEQTVIRSTIVIGGDGQQGFQVTYYNRTKFFTLNQVISGELEEWTQSVYRDFEDLFPCAVKVAEELLSSVLAENVSEQFSKSEGGEDISATPQQVNYAIRSTQGEEKWITSCLNAIFDQDYKNFEVIIVDNNSSDLSLERAKEFKVKTINIEKFKPGKAINDGIRNSSGEIIVCLSGHCVPTSKNWLSNLINDLSNNKIAGVYGRQEPFSFSSDLDKRDLINLFGLDKKTQINDTFFHNANSSFTRKMWKKIRRFSKDSLIIPL